MISALSALSGLSATSVDLDDPNSVSPGILGFLAFFLLAIALYLLVRNMNGHLRRVNYRQEALDKQAAAEAAEAEAVQAKATADSDAPNGASADPAEGPSTPTP